jgi:predicted esterase
MTREDRETDIADYVGYLNALYDSIVSRLASPRVTVLGFSQGGATANRWLTRGKSRADRLIMWGSLMPQDQDLEKAAEYFRTTELLIVYGLRDQYAGNNVIENFRQLLDDSRIPHRVVTFDGGHRMDRETLKSLAD